MKRVISIDPGNVVTTFEADGDTFRVNRTQDVEPHLEFAKVRRDDEEYSRRGIKNGWWHMAHIPLWVLEDWYSKGYTQTVLCQTEDDLKKVLKLLETDYRWLKTTAGRL